MCKVPNCPEQHPTHKCRNCQNGDSDHFSSKCPFPPGGMQNKPPQFNQQGGGYQGGGGYQQPPNNFYQGNGGGNYGQYNPYPPNQPQSPGFLDNVRNFFSGGNNRQPQYGNGMGFPNQVRCRVHGCN